MRSESDKTRLTIRILIAVVVFLAIIVLYFVILQPQYNNLVIKSQNEGVNLFISQYLVPQLQQNGYVSLPVGNQTIYLVPVQPGNGTSSNTTGTTSGNTTK